MQGIDINLLVPKAYYLNKLKEYLFKEETPGIKFTVDTFFNILKKNLEIVNEQQLKVERLTVDLVTGKLENLHELMIEANKAQVLLNFTIAVRDRLLRAYEELIHILR
jgi:flagellar hook-basal body complex protein FliE